MSRRTLLLALIFVVGFGLVSTALAAGAQHERYRGRKYKPPPPTANIVVSVVRKDDNVPIPNAAVVFSITAGEDYKGNMEIRTDENGKAVINVLPIGDTMLLQIIAKDYQTFGKIYKIDKPDMSIEVELRRPQPQFTGFANSGKKAGAGKNAGEKKAPDSAKQKDSKDSGQAPAK